MLVSSTHARFTEIGQHDARRLHSLLKADVVASLFGPYAKALNLCFTGGWRTECLDWNKSTLNDMAVSTNSVFSFWVSL